MKTSAADSVLCPIDQSEEPGMILISSDISPGRGGEWWETIRKSQ